MERPLTVDSHGDLHQTPSLLVPATLLIGTSIRKSALTCSREIRHETHRVKLQLPTILRTLHITALARTVN